MNVNATVSTNHPQSYGEWNGASKVDKKWKIVMWNGCYARVRADRPLAIIFQYRCQGASIMYFDSTILGH